MSVNESIRYIDENLNLNEIKESLNKEEAKLNPDINILKNLRYKRLIFILKQSKVYTAQITKHMKDNLIEDSNILNVKNENNSTMPKKKRKITCEPKSHNIELLTGGNLYPYQLYGVHWMKSLFESGVNGILGDEMGLGKTIQVIGLIASLIEDKCPGPFLILAPLSALQHWSKEFEKFTPKLKIILLNKDREECTSILKNLKSTKTKSGLEYYPIILANYEKLIYNKAFSKINWLSIFIDEGHRLRSENSLLWKKLFAFENSFRIILTGTPIQNNLRELWSMLHFLLPNLFDDASLFESWFEINDFNDDSKILEEESQNHIFYLMKEVLHPFLLRRVKSDVNINLPPKNIVNVYGYMTERQKTLYSQILKKDISSEHKKTKNMDELNKPIRVSKAKAKIYMKISNIDPHHVIPTTSNYYTHNSEDFEEFQTNFTNSHMMDLRKTANHPYLVQKPYQYSKENLINSSGKLLLLDAMLHRLKAQGHRVLLFSEFVIVLDILEEYLEYRKYNYLRLDGNVPMDQRETDIVNFNSNNDIFIYLISTRAGGLGINLTKADTVILYDIAWNPQVDLQAQDRCHRIGQTKPVIVYRLIMKGSIDEHMLTRSNAKKKLDKLIIPNGEFAELNNSIKLYDPWELLNLLQSMEDSITVQSNGLMYTDEEFDQLMDRTKIFKENIY